MSASSVASVGRRPACPPLRQVHLRRTRSRCQRSTVSGVTSMRLRDKRRRPLLVGCRSFVASRASVSRSHRDRRGCGRRRSSIRSWCRSTTISRSFAPSDCRRTVSRSRIMATRDTKADQTIAPPGHDTPYRQENSRQPSHGQRCWMTIPHSTRDRLLPRGRSPSLGGPCPAMARIIDEAAAPPQRGAVTY